MPVGEVALALGCLLDKVFGGSGRFWRAPGGFGGFWRVWRVWRVLEGVWSVWKGFGAFGVFAGLHVGEGVWRVWRVLEGLEGF